MSTDAQLERHCEISAHQEGWFRFQPWVWVHIFPWEDVPHQRPPYIIGTARDVCLLQGLETGDTTL